MRLSLLAPGFRFNYDFTMLTDSEMRRFQA
jgi:hypothetical protein